MKLRRILCVAAALCLLWTMAAADGSGYSYNNLVNIREKAVMPYTWDGQKPEELSGMQYLLDGIRSTGFQHVCWNDLALDEIPEFTFYFSNASIRALWVRNGWESARYPFTDYARVLRMDVVVWVGETSYGPYKFTLQDTNDPTILSETLYDGYQRLALPQRFTNVTKVDLYIKGWYKGDGHPYIAFMSDLLFMPDTLPNLYGSWIYDPGHYSYATPTPTPYWAPTPTPYWAPTQVPTATPRPVITQAPGTGLQVMTTDRLATRSGPGTTYTEQGSYFQSGTWVKAISSAYDSRNQIWWIQVELTYNGELRRVYTGVKRLNMAADQVPAEQAEGGATLTRSVYAYWGPGYGYSMYGEVIPAGTSGTVYAREGYYAQFEFYDEASQLLRRVWVPESALQSSNG